MKWKKHLAIFLVFSAIFVAVWFSIPKELKLTPFVPWNSLDSQCLKCGQHRFEKWVDSVKVADNIEETEISRWIDTFMPVDHSHVWLAFSSNRNNGSGEVIACGGIGANSMIHHMRGRIGEEKAQELIREFHVIIDESGANDLDSDRLRGFEAKLTQLYQQTNELAPKSPSP